MRVWTTTMRVNMTLMCMYCAYAPCTSCVCVCAGLPMCVLTLRRPSFRTVFVCWDGHVRVSNFSCNIPGVPHALFLHMDDLFCSGCESFLERSAAGHARGPRVH